MSIVSVIFLGLIIASLVSYSIEKDEQCRETGCDRVIASFLDSQNASLTATLDMSKENEKINQYVAQALEEKMENLTKMKLEEVLRFLNLEDKLNRYLDKIRHNLSDTITNYIERVLKQMTDASKDKPSFFAILTFDLTSSGKENLKFDAVETNIKNGYNVKTGIYTVPQAGVYEFTIQILKQYVTNGLEVSLIKNNRMISKGYCDKEPYSSCSINAILEVNIKMTRSLFEVMEKYMARSTVLFLVT